MRERERERIGRAAAEELRTAICEYLSQLLKLL